MALPRVRVGRSPASVRHWLAKFGLQTAETRRLALRRSVNEGVDGPVRWCEQHGWGHHVLRGTTYRCSRCSGRAVTTRRRRVKRLLVAEAGGACVRCGYDRCLAALQFHHVDPGTKLTTVSRNGGTRSLDDARAEAAKCILLCANCHAEVEHGAADLSLRSTAASSPDGVTDPG